MWFEKIFNAEKLVLISFFLIETNELMRTALLFSDVGVLSGIISMYLSQLSFFTVLK